MLLIEQQTELQRQHCTIYNDVLFTNNKVTRETTLRQRFVWEFHVSLNLQSELHYILHLGIISKMSKKGITNNILLLMRRFITKKLQAVRIRPSADKDGRLYTTLGEMVTHLKTSNDL